MTPRNAMAGLFAAVALSACADGTGPGDDSVPVSLSIGAGAGRAAGAPLAAAEITLGGNTIQIDDVRLVLRKIALHRQADGVDCDEAGEASCDVLWLGPILVDLALDGSTSHAFTADAAPGTFRRMLFQIHKPAGQADLAFVALNPGMAGVSVRVSGTFDGEPFGYTTDLTVVQHTALEPPLEVAEGVPTALTLWVDVESWFHNQAGTGLINPGDLGVGGQLDARIRQNIRESFRAAYNQ
ncbi:MAG TPA: hypothetical protein VMK53_02235 [Gemmatimonadales bacterium]|nr:hypothetical protein [Gemmatimonadales bacterium]